MILIAIAYRAAPELLDSNSWNTGFLRELDGGWGVQYANEQGQPDDQAWLNVSWDGSYGISNEPQLMQLDSNLNVLVVKPRVVTYKIAIREL